MNAVASLLGMIRRAPRSVIELLLPRITEAASDCTAAERALNGARASLYDDEYRASGAVRRGGSVTSPKPGILCDRRCAVWKRSLMAVALTLPQLGDVRDLSCFSRTPEPAVLS